MIILRCFQDNLLIPEVDELLHFIIELRNSASEKGGHNKGCLFRISFSKLKSIRQS